MTVSPMRSVVGLRGGSMFGTVLPEVTMRTYLWCVWANKFTFWGYIFLLSGHALMGLVGDHWLIDVVVYSGGCAVGATLGGLYTLMAYQRARIVLIKTNGTLDPELYFRL